MSAVLSDRSPSSFQSAFNLFSETIRRSIVPLFEIIGPLFQRHHQVQCALGATPPLDSQAMALFKMATGPFSARTWLMRSIQSRMSQLSC
jgi:hypothetical protein